ncbi:MAG: WD40 repeat domain-containing protein [Xanthobacteraceae bacterium]
MIAVADSSCFQVRRVRKIDTGGQVVALKFVGATAGFVLGEEAILLVASDGGERRVAVHDGAILSVAADGAEIVTGGDDGRIVMTDASGATRVVATDARRRWIDCVSWGNDMRLAWSAGKQVYVACGGGEPCAIDLRSTAGGLAFGRDAATLAIAHYGAVTFWQANGETSLDRLEWKGAHVDVRFSPAGNFLVTRMQEPALHGWRLQDRREMPMHGYGACVKSIDWSCGGKWLATSGSQYLVLWPFEQAESPLTGVPLLLAGYRAMATAVSCHPHHDIVAVGYADGLVLLIRIEDEAEVLIKNPGSSEVSSLAWSADGGFLAIACADGSGRIIEFVQPPIGDARRMN